MRKPTTGGAAAAAAAVGVAALYAVVAVPGSPVSRWLADLVADSGVAAVAPGQAAPTPSPRPARELRGAIGAMVSPARTIEDYDHLYRLVAERLGMSPKIVQRKRYLEVNELLENGEVDFAWVCTGAVADLQQRGVADPVVAPVVAGAARYRAYLIVNRSSGIEALAQLRGRRFAFTDPLSLTGRAVVERRLAELGESPASFFSETFFTHAHDNSIRAVQRGLAAGASVDSLVFDQLLRDAPEEVDDVAVVWASEWFPSPPIVVARRAPAELVSSLRAAFTSLHESAAGRAVLADVGIDRFAAASAGDYRPR